MSLTRSFMKQLLRTAIRERRLSNAALDNLGQ